MYELVLDFYTDTETIEFFRHFIPFKFDVISDDTITIQVSNINKLLRDGEIVCDYESAYTAAFKKFESFNYKVKTNMNLEILLNTHSEKNCQYIINVRQL